MHFSSKLFHSQILFLKMLLLFTAFTGLFPSASKGQIAIFGDRVYTMQGDPVDNGVVLLRNGKIETAGPVASIPVPAEYHQYHAAVVTPGLIDTRSVVGLAGYYNQDEDQDQLEYSHALQPELRALDAYNAQEELVGFLRSNGVTTLHTGHAPGAVISGQTMLVKTSGSTVDEALIDSTFALAITLGSTIRSNYDTPGTRAKTISMLRQELIRAQEYAHQRNHPDPDKRPSRNLRMEALSDMMDGKISALITAHRSHDIITALRLQKEFGFPMLLDGASEAYLVLEPLLDAGVPVLIHPTMIRLRGDTEHASFITAKKLSDAGILFAFQSGFEAYVPKTRVVLFEAAIAAGFGLEPQKALQALTIDAARIIGMDHRLGSLEAGKDADLVLFNGDPFEYTTKATHVFIDGKLVWHKETDQEKDSL